MAAAEISAGFDVRELTSVLNWLGEQELDAEEECILRRVISKDGRSKGYINGRPVPAQTLRKLGEQLIDIHGTRKEELNLFYETLHEVFPEVKGLEGDEDL